MRWLNVTLETVLGRSGLLSDCVHMDACRCGNQLIMAWSSGPFIIFFTDDSFSQLVWWLSFIVFSDTLFSNSTADLYFTSKGSFWEKNNFVRGLDMHSPNAFTVIPVPPICCCDFETECQTALLTSLPLLTCMQIVLQGRKVCYSLIETCRLGNGRQWEISHSLRCTCSTCSTCSICRTHPFTSLGLLASPLQIESSSVSSTWCGVELKVPEE